MKKVKWEKLFFQWLVRLTYASRWCSPRENVE